MFGKMHRVMCFIVTALLILLQITCQNDVKKQFLCKNEGCSESIGSFLVISDYKPNSEKKIPATRGERGVILAKPKDDSTKLFFVEIKNVTGFLPSNFIQEERKGKATITVDLSIPVDIVSKPDSNRASPVPNLNENEEMSVEPKNLDVIDAQTDDINSTVTSSTVEGNHDNIPPINDNPSESGMNENESTISKLKPSDDEFSDVNQTSSEQSNGDQTGKNAKPDKSEDESLRNLQPLAEVIQNESVELKNEEQIVLNVSAKLENSTLEISESELVNVTNDSENKSESSTNVNLNVSENSTHEMNIEEKNVSEVIETSSVSPSNKENYDSPTIHDTSNTSNSSTNENRSDPAISTNTFNNIPMEGFFVQDSANPNISAEGEASGDLGKNVQQNLESAKIDHSTSTFDKGLSDPSQNDSATSEVPSDSGADIKQTSEIPKTDSVPPATEKVNLEEKINVESKVELPPIASTIRMFPDNRESSQPSVAVTEPKTPPAEIVTSTESEDENINSEEINSTLNDTLDLVSSNVENEQTEVNQPQNDPVTPDGVLKELPSPPHIESATESIVETTTLNSTEDNSNSNESIPFEPMPISTESTISEETVPYKTSDTYKYHQSQPYPSLFPKTVTENLPPIVAEKIDQVPTQEIDETGMGGGSKYENPTTESTSIPYSVDQNQGLSGYIHTPRKKVNEEEPQPTIEPENVEEKSIYETVMEYLPDLSGLSWSLIEAPGSLFNFGSSTQKEDLQNEVCSAEQFCGTDRLNSHMDKAENLESETIIEIPLLGIVNKEQVTFVSGVLTSVLFATILLWWLMNYFNKNRKVGLLVSRINQLENKLLISSKEIASLQNKLVENDSQVEAKRNAADTKRITEVYEHKINQYKKRIVELDDKVLYLEKELENVSNSALEMHKLLENSLATQALSKTAIDEMETLRALTESQENQIDDMRAELNSVVTENQCLKVDNEMNKSTIKKLEKECNAQTKKNVELSEKNRNLTLQLDKELENNNVLESNYKSEIYELRSKLEDVEMSLKRSEFQVQELQRAVLDKHDGVHSSKNDVQLKIQISTLEAMNNELNGLLNEQKNARRMLEDHVGDVTKELNNLKKLFENSEKERNQAVTKLEVLTQYFKDKEEQLLKKLEATDKLSLERESKDQSLSQKLALMREEIDNLKVINEELKKEILDQEASYKVQLANAEQKTREHWFALRQAERKYKESQQEAAILRNKILVLETNMSSISHKVDDKNNTGLNGEISGVSPILYRPSLSPELLPYPSPTDFIPPPLSPVPSHSMDFFPPEPIYSPDERLPPLGGRRAPSPPPPVSPDDDFSPPPPVMKFPPGRNHNIEPPPPGGYGRRTPPPTGRHRSQFKPRQPRSSIDSPSSGMSLESLDKSGR